MVDLRFERPGRIGAPATNSGVVMRKRGGCNSAFEAMVIDERHLVIATPLYVRL